MMDGHATRYSRAFLLDKNFLTGTSALKIRRDLDGSVGDDKARYCVRGDK
jgi:hypothetical protein